MIYITLNHKARAGRAVLLQIECAWQPASEGRGPAIWQRAGTRTEVAVRVREREKAGERVPNSAPRPSSSTIALTFTTTTSPDFRLVSCQEQESSAFLASLQLAAGSEICLE